MDPSMCYIPETPVSNEQDDCFNRTELVEEVCNILRTCDASNGYVVGLCGKWGSGKTTVLNFVKNKIRNDNDLIIIDFNPWLYSSQDILYEQFFSTLANELRPRWIKILNLIYNLIFDFELVDNQSINKVSRFIKLFYKAFTNESKIPLENCKEKISEAIVNSRKRVIVIMDDIDRLECNEIKMILKLVRSVANFSNVIYVLSYDEKILLHAYNDGVDVDEPYIRKIVNHSIYIPIVNPQIYYETLRQTLIKMTGIDNITHREELILSIISELVNNYRNIIQICNIFITNYKISVNNTCPIDLMALCSIQYLDNEVYGWIKDNIRFLCLDLNEKSIRSIMMNEKKYRPSDKYLEDSCNIKFIELLSILFPNFSDRSRFIDYDHEYMISDYSTFWNYFQLSPSSLYFSNQKLEDFIRGSADECDRILNDYAEIMQIVVSISKRIVRKVKSKRLSVEQFEKVVRYFLVENKLNTCLYTSCYESIQYYVFNFSKQSLFNYINTSIAKMSIHQLISNILLITKLKNSGIASNEEHSDLVTKLINALPISIQEIDPEEILWIVAFFKDYRTKDVKKIIDELMRAKDTVDTLEQYCRNTNRDPVILLQVIDKDQYPVEYQKFLDIHNFK